MTRSSAQQPRDSNPQADEGNDPSALQGASQAQNIQTPVSLIEDVRTESREKRKTLAPVMEIIQRM